MPSLVKRKWNRLASGLYVPPFIGRLLPKIPKAEFAGGYPCCCPIELCFACTSQIYSLAQDVDIVVDVGIGGWADESCALCDEISGEFVTSWQIGCTWRYNEDPYCVSNGTTFEFSVSAQVLEIPAGTIFWQVGVGVTSTIGGISGSTSVWESTKAETGDDCFEKFKSGDKITVTKVQEQHFGFPRPCSGTMPNTITIIDVAA